jgi:hypothetical protein
MQINSEEQLEETLSRPAPADIEAMRALEGDVMVLGVGGKMGPSLVRLMQRATAESNDPHREEEIQEGGQHDPPSVENTGRSRGAAGRFSLNLRQCGHHGTPIDRLITFGAKYTVGHPSDELSGILRVLAWI